MPETKICPYKIFYYIHMYLLTTYRSRHYPLEREEIFSLSTKNTPTLEMIISIIIPAKFQILKNYFAGNKFPVTFTPLRILTFSTIYMMPIMMPMMRKWWMIMETNYFFH